MSAAKVSRIKAADSQLAAFTRFHLEPREAVSVSGLFRFAHEKHNIANPHRLINIKPSVGKNTQFFFHSPCHSLKEELHNLNGIFCIIRKD